MEEYDLDDSVEVSVGNSGSRKRQKGLGQAEAVHSNLVAHSNLAEVITESLMFKCSEIMPADIKVFRDKLFAIPNKTVQDQFISLHVDPIPIARKRANSGVRKQQSFILSS